MFDAKKKAFYEVAMFVLMLVERALFEPIRAWRNDGGSADLLNVRNQSVGIVGFVRNYRSRIQSFEQRGGLLAVVHLPCGQSPPRHQSQSLDQRMYLGGQSAARAAKRLFAVFFGAPAACW